jgi:Flp pilus assembly pilin Flp
MVEYVLIIGFVALVLIAVVTVFGTTIETKFQALIDGIAPTTP